MAAAACQLMLPAATTEGEEAQGMVPERGEIAVLFAFAILFGLD